MVDQSDEVLFEAADRTIQFYGADPQGIGTKPCECAQRAIDQGYMSLDPDCAKNRCKELRAESPTSN